MAPTLNGPGVMECESRLPVKGDKRRVDKHGTGVFIRWNGTVEWNGGMERWNGIVEWNGGIVE